MIRRVLFPLFNGLVCMLLGAMIGYYVRHPLAGIWVGAASGILLGAVVEALARGSAVGHWLYRRRALWLVVLEVPLALFVAGPYAYVAVEARPHAYEVCCETPLDYGAASYDNVHIATPDGATLSGWYVPPRAAPGPVVILLPGAGADRRGTAWHARQLVAAGYGALMFDPRGLAESTGRSVSLGWQHVDDVTQVALYVRTLPGADPQRIGLLGLSRGAHLALNAAYLHPDCFRGLWLDGLGAQKLDDFPTPSGAGETFEWALNGAILRMAELQLGEPVPPAFGEMLTALDRPRIMLVASGLDAFERQTNEKYARLARTSRQTWLIANAWHTGGPSVAEEEYRQRMLRFFEQAFREPAGACEVPGAMSE